MSEIEIIERLDRDVQLMRTNLTKLILAVTPFIVAAIVAGAFIKNTQMHLSQRVQQNQMAIEGQKMNLEANRRTTEQNKWFIKRLDERVTEIRDAQKVLPQKVAEELETLMGETSK